MSRLSNPGPTPVSVYGSGGTIVAPITAKMPNSDDNPVTDEGLLVLSYLYGYNSITGGWDRVRVSEGNADGIAATTEGINAQTFLHYFNGSTWDRVQAQLVDADTLPAATTEGMNALAFLYGYNGVSWDRLITTEANADGVSDTHKNLATNTNLYGFNGASWDRIRAANTFKTASVTAAGSSIVWNPGAGNFFRLMGFSISVAGTTAAAEIQTIQLLDGATVIKNFVCPLGTTVNPVAVFAEDLGQGYLSALAANDLNIGLGFAMATGAVTINAWGTQGPTA
jgi:hypothetical protein